MRNRALFFVVFQYYWLGLSRCDRNRKFWKVWEASRDLSRGTAAKLARSKCLSLSLAHSLFLSSSFPFFSICHLLRLVFVSPRLPEPQFRYVYRQLTVNNTYNLYIGTGSKQCNEAVEFMQRRANLHPLIHIRSYFCYHTRNNHI